MILRKSIIIFFIFILFYKNLGADELVPSIRLGYDNYGDINLHHVESDDRTGDMSKGWGNFLTIYILKGFQIQIIFSGVLVDTQDIHLKILN